MEPIAYSGTSAYKMDDYYNYTRSAQQKQDQRKEKQRAVRVINIKKISVVISVIFVIASVYLYTNAVLIQTSSELNDLTRELEDMKVRNTQVAFDISSGVDYSVVEQKAISEFGMQHPESYQNVYVDVIQSDYVEVADSKVKTGGFVEGIISNVQSFLAYIK